MLDKIITAIEPFAITIIILAGASLAHWMTFTNSYAIGVAAVFCGILLMLKHIILQVKKG